MGLGGLNLEVGLALGGYLLAMEVMDLGVGREFSQQTLTELFELGAKSPSISMTTPSAVLVTQPPKLKAVAS